MRPALGVVAICFNEEQDLPGFLDHLLPWVDEIVLVDDGSTDQTEAIALSYGDPVKFIKSPRSSSEYFSHQRNKGIDAAVSDWLLHMDIDERVSPDLAREIQLVINDPGKDAYRFRRLNYFMHRPMRGGGWQQWNLVHLARRSVLRFEGMFHEHCAVNVAEARVGQLNARMIHLNENNFGKRLRKSDTYLEEVTNSVRERNPQVNGLTIAVRTAMEFVKKYFLKKGFLDGTPGLISAIHASCAVFRGYALVWDEQNKIPREQLEQKLKDEWKAAGDINDQR